MLIGVLGSIVLQIALSPFAPSAGGREILFFNNPNQLGYWAVISGSLFFLLASRLRVPLLVQLLGGAAVAYLAALSLSKAAIVSVGVMLALVFLRRPRHAVIAACAVCVVMFVAADSALVESVMDRISNIGEQQDDNLTGRGYDRIWKWPEYLVFGAGEGALWRFYTKLEVHSTFGTLLFSYGIPGFGLFCLLVYRIFQQGGLASLVALAPAFLFGLTHQGLRQSMLWALFALAAVIPEPRASRAGVRSRVRPPPVAARGAVAHQIRRAHEVPPH